MVAGEPPPGIIPANGVDLAMQARIRLAEIQIDRLVQQRVEVFAGFFVILEGAIQVVAFGVLRELGQ